MKCPVLALILIGDLNCVIPLRDFEVKIDRFQIKQDMLNLKWTLEDHKVSLMHRLICLKGSTGV